MERPFLHSLFKIMWRKGNRFQRLQKTPPERGKLRTKITVKITRIFPPTPLPYNPYGRLPQRQQPPPYQPSPLPFRCTVPLLGVFQCQVPVFPLTLASICQLSLTVVGTFAQPLLPQTLFRCLHSWLPESTVTSHLYSVEGSYGL